MNVERFPLSLLQEAADFFYAKALHLAHRCGMLNQ